MDSSITHQIEAGAEPTQTNIHPSRQANFNPHNDNYEDGYDDADDIGTEDEDEAEIAAAMGFASFGKGKGGAKSSKGTAKVVKEAGRASKRRRMHSDVDVQIPEQGDTARAEMEQEIGTGQSATTLPQRLVQAPFAQPDPTSTASWLQSPSPSPAVIPSSSFTDTSFIRQLHTSASAAPPSTAQVTRPTTSTASERSQQEIHLLRTTGLRDSRTGDLAFFRESFVEDPWRGWKGTGAGAG